jgi:hypothetical protein
MVKRLIAGVATVVLVLLGGAAIPAHAAGAGQFIAARYTVLGRAACIEAVSLTDGAPLRDEECAFSPTSRQSWYVEWSGGKAIVHSAADYSKCMENLFDPHGNVVIWRCDGTSGQKWNVAQLGNGESMWGNIIDGTTCLALDPHDFNQPIYQEDCGPHYGHTIWRG